MILNCNHKLYFSLKYRYEISHVFSILNNFMKIFMKKRERDEKNAKKKEI